MNSIKNVWICPANPKNLQISIVNTFENNEYMWAFSEKFVKKWNNLSIGDLCIFGNTKNKFKYAAIVKDKMIITDDNWPFKSPSGCKWKYGYTLEQPFEIDLSSEDIKKLTNLNAWMTQTKVKDEYKNSIINEIYK